MTVVRLVEKRYLFFKCNSVADISVYSGTYKIYNSLLRATGRNEKKLESKTHVRSVQRAT